jgi:hypothetical protein
MNLFRFIPGYTEYVYDAGKEPLLLLLIAFLVAFLLTRAYTRIARVRGWGSTHVGDVHMHHVVVGIVLSSRWSSIWRTSTGRPRAAPRWTRW